MMTYKHTCQICGNHTEQNRSSLPKGWFELNLSDNFEDVLRLTICGLCLPIPLTKSSLMNILPMIRKILFRTKGDE